MKNTRIPRRVLNQATDLRKAGFTWRECGEMLDYRGPSLRNACMSIGYARQYDRVTPEQYARARELRDTLGLPWKAIAREVGANWMTLYKVYRNGK